MRKATTIVLAVLMAVMFTTCKPAAKSGAAAGEALVKMMPAGTMGVMALDVRRAMETEAAKKALQDPEAKAKYDEFVRMSGIDPMKDIAYVGFGLMGEGGSIMEGGAVVNMTYDPAKLRALIKEKAPEAAEEDYNGVPVFSNLDGTDQDGQKTRAAFLDVGHVVIGSEKMVKGVIDVHGKRTDSLAKDPQLAAALNKVDKSGIAWGAFAVPQDLLKKGIESQPQMKALEGVTALTMMFDYRLAAFIADIRAHGGTKEQNENLAGVLNGLKGLGAMFAAQEPLAGEVLDAIAISSGADYTRVSVNLPQSTLDKIAEMAKARAGDFIKIGKDEPAEEKK
jgi:hypothetical protein